MARTDRWTITPWQLISLIFGATVGVGILTLPREVDRIAGTAGWLSTLLGGAIALGAAWVMTFLIGRYPGRTYVEFIPEILGPVPGFLLVLLMLIYQISVVSLFSRAFGEV
ncbi:MAG: spore germination protein, partial [Firmicutes bacterium]|nr:spore germination protein [Bacillota bacterium]